MLEFTNWDSTPAARQEGDMEVLYPHCAGLDVHKETVVACMRHMVGGTVKREVRTFDTILAGIRELHRRGHGGDGRLLEAGLAHPE